MNTSLYHHGILGQRWGVRRYQNADGSLTKAGQKRYGTLSNFKKVQSAKKAASPEALRAKRLKAKADARTQKEIEKYQKKAGIKVAKPEKEIKQPKPKKKSISEMTDDEIRARIERLTLENRLSALTPQDKTRGQKFVDGFLDVGGKLLKDTTTKMVTAAVDKAIKEYTNPKKAKSELEKWTEKADIAEKKKKWKEAMDIYEGKNNKDKDDDKYKQAERDAKWYDNRTKIDNGQKKFNEGPYANTESSRTRSETTSNSTEERQTSNSSRNNAEERQTSNSSREDPGANVSGTGTHQRGNRSESNRTQRQSEPIDAEWEDVEDWYPALSTRRTNYLAEMEQLRRRNRGN